MYELSQECSVFGTLISFICAHASKRVFKHPIIELIAEFIQLLCALLLEKQESVQIDVEQYRKNTLI